MRRFIIMILLCTPGLCLSADRFRLESELRINFVDGGSVSSFFTGYTYDENGIRVQSRVWAGTDSVTAAMSSIKFTYDISGNLTEELLLTGADTSGIVRHVYGGGRLIAVKTLDKTDAIRFTDSLLYNEQGAKTEEQRISSTGVKTFFHRYKLNARGNPLADTLYELVASAYVATQAVLFNYNADSTVASESTWRLSGSGWYCISTSFMTYAAGSLVSVATHDRDGVGTPITDSLAYVNDGNGNRTREEAYNGGRALIRRITYTWRDMQPVVVLVGEAAIPLDRSVLSVIHDGLIISLLPHDRGEVALYTISGKQLYRVTVDHSGVVPLQRLPGKGTFVAVLTTGSGKQIINFSNYN